MVRVIFYKPYHLLGWIIAKVTKSKYSHVGIMFNEYTVSDINLGGRVVARSLRLNSEYYDIVNVKAVIDFNKYYTYLDRKYDVRGALSYVFPFLKSRNRRYTCAEYVCNMLGLPEVVSPEELYEMLKYVKLIDERGG